MTTTLIARYRMLDRSNPNQVKDDSGNGYHLNWNGQYNSRGLAFSSTNTNTVATRFLTPGVLTTHEAWTFHVAFQLDAADTNRRLFEIILNSTSISAYLQSGADGLQFRLEDQNTGIYAATHEARWGGRLDNALGTDIIVSGVIDATSGDIALLINGQVAYAGKPLGFTFPADAEGVEFRVGELLESATLRHLELRNGAEDIGDLARASREILKNLTDAPLENNTFDQRDGDAADKQPITPVVVVKYNPTTQRYELPGAGGAVTEEGAQESTLQDIKTLLDQLVGTYGIDAIFTTLAIYDARFQGYQQDFGNTNDAAAPDDTGNASLIARLKRISTQTTSILGRLWPSLGQNTSANSVPVVLPNDQTVNTTNPNIGSTNDAAAGTDTSNTSLIGLTKRSNQNLSTVNSNIGATTEGAAGTDTSNSGLNGLIKRGLQRMTTLLSVLPASLGQKTSAASFAVVLPSDQTVNTANRAVTITARAPQRITSVSTAGTTNLTVPGSTTHCTVQAQGTRIYYRLDGTAAAITDQYIEAGGYLSIQGTHMTSARFCSESGAGIIAVNYWQETP